MKNKDYYKTWYASKTKEELEALKDRKLETRRVRIYGVPRSRLDELIDLQYGACPGCLRDVTSSHQPDETSNTRSAVDHSHTTGKVRGVLCGRCNRLIGLADEDPLILKMLAAYIEDTKE